MERGRRCVRPVLVVRMDALHQDPKLFQHLRWLRESIAKENPWWTYILYLDQGFIPCNDPEAFNELWRWHLYDNWEGLYYALRLGVLYPATLPGKPRPYFSAAFFVNLRLDRNAAGVGYGRYEVRSERLLLRACALESRGNFLILDWGIPVDFPSNPRFTNEQLANIYDREYYLYNDAAARQPLWKDPDGPRQYGKRNAPGFAKLLRLGRFLRPISSEEDALPEEYVEQMQSCAAGELFTQKNMDDAWWAAWWDLYFAMDTSILAWSRWQRFHLVQHRAIRWYEWLRTWWASSTWLQIMGDFCGFMVAGVLYGVVGDFRAGRTLQISFVRAPLALMGWFVLTSVTFTDANGGLPRNRLSVSRRTAHFIGLACVTATLMSVPAVAVYTQRAIDIATSSWQAIAHWWCAPV